MTRAQRPAVRVTEEHLKYYEELAPTGIRASQAMEQAQVKFGLPRAHTRQSLAPYFRQRGITFNRSGRRAKVAVDIKKRGDGQPTWDQVKDFILGAIETASRVPELESELHKYRVGYDNAMLQLKELAKTKDEAKRYELALQQGEVKAPLGKGKSGSSLTYHI